MATASNKSRAEDDLDKFSPKNEMDYLIRQQENTFTQTKYLFYKLYDTEDKTWNPEQKKEWGSSLNEDGTRKSELFDGIPSDHRYVVAIPETGEWKSFKSRSYITKSGADANGAMYPFARWSRHEKARMATYGAMKTMSLACSMALPENCDNEIAYLKAGDIEQAALMLLNLDAERRENADHYLLIRDEEE